MPRNNNGNNQEGEERTPRNWTEWREEVHQALEELDRSLAQARQAIYRLRPMVRPKNGETQERPERQEKTVPFRGRRRERP